ncbi:MULTISPECIES: Asp-tRNA(Asn)/Glu-tRNA(Gln) amidotransferase subunit GatC [Clostridium]|jgi:aspartyl-tRNA(Asn)/glutamyl-tRNA(Gln) amidotransferase subunit C|uniref:Aspartyl/glutamyl-tRNA(Asn/Gln) amidotransferase subunit C n=1 Tax=Clostridium saccharoperbutylacetonicum N1-4(HMT) TaxID=931276 RepID=M1LV27_9CLOT|nr:MULTISPECIES: Asp-tRNA(Asn)/Glu-tRNA(Gln) amidotransferase subunit GatC [Clostridium]AGF56960.1 aspartyl/glutamyl-tRNA(Asn/Gln) amidotransferase subunit C [Clostridium saccharoperbutylacetonicum N1-4(HMT)]AQR95690.1 glutamyl-tRNA(Gln) amidotransferase subunit C [Clostridium saccharoperbutylacetonicum]NRT62281.1 aspartyl-tRNA(Asn)/glutamyl-tRNA(Gln) amidotransferase subunit C [Clostridium saccharoperbutylacetonicum]NSB25617.1 aspartyl-tRNA(Asn)/glutamyl-tRNA(Gln) amidotransferase subunit C [C
MKVSIDEVKYIAKLSKLKFSDEEAAKFASEFESILENFQYLNELDLEVKEEINDKAELKPVVRKDEVKTFECKDLFRNVKDMQETYLKVPKIIE